MNQRLLVSQLQITHPDWDAYSPFWRTIRDLKEGAMAIKRNIQKYLPKRPDEDKELYEMRLNKFSYHPVMSDAVNKYSSKLAGSPVHLSNAEHPFWGEFRANNSKPGATMRKESNLLHELFNGLLYYSRTWAAVDRPDLGINPRSAYESRGLKNHPYICLYEPLDVLYWDEDWAISRHIYPLVKPFQAPLTICRWTYYGPNENLIYEAPVTLKSTKDSEGNIHECVDKVKIGSEWLSWDDPKCALDPTKVWTHNYGMRLITSLTLPSEKWVCKQVYNKQIQHLRIENAWTDAGYLSGTVQRIFTPPDAPPIDDPRISYEQPDYAAELAKAGNTHILIGKGYQFVESTGAALGNLQQQLDKIETQIKTLVSLHFASTNTSTLNQSGASKAVDMSLLEDSMRDYGQQVIVLYNGILRIVARMVNLPEPTATGLNNYAVDNLTDLLTQLTIAEDLPYVPPTAKKIAYGKLAQLMVGTASPEDEEKIKEELDSLFNRQEVTDPSLEEDSQEEDSNSEPSISEDIQKAVVRETIDVTVGKPNPKSRKPRVQKDDKVNEYISSVVDKMM